MCYSLFGINPVYWPWGSGYFSLIHQTQQLGMTTLWPPPNAPYCQTTYCLYAAYRDSRLSVPGSAESSKARISLRVSLTNLKTDGLRHRSSNVAVLLIHLSGRWPQHFLSRSVGISLQLLQVHQCSDDAEGRVVAWAAWAKTSNNIAGCCTKTSWRISPRWLKSRSFTAD